MPTREGLSLFLILINISIKLCMCFKILFRSVRIFKIICRAISPPPTFFKKVSSVDNCHLGSRAKSLRPHFLWGFHPSSSVAHYTFYSVRWARGQKIRWATTRTKKSPAFCPPHPNKRWAKKGGPHTQSSEVLHLFIFTGGIYAKKNRKSDVYS